ncbi:NAD-dependent epimerase/dehydratase family protein [Fulvivirga sp. RKSG066]|uniref:SDR family oxidoreductase n=1 Tax=Fulvivirga aurantia TaxID=2529383 RepID=UPI0012BD3C2D|nr:NmrA family NAD(P)-binding protein [Fulvivirga aurantia]MTI21899.1 NAD-dependent epimerase/dehydratase family protein [Fulvivirga aurantia]
MNRILVTGGTGNLGKAIVALLIKNNCDVTVLTSQNYLPTTNHVSYTYGNLAIANSLSGLENAFDIIIHCASNALNTAAIDIEGSQNLISAISTSRIKHFIYISIVGVDQSSFDYYKSKVYVEDFLIASGLPYSIIRATQFHDFIYHWLIKPIDTGLENNLQIPSDLYFQSIDKNDVARKVLELTTLGPINKTINIGGPEVLKFEQMAEAYLFLLKRQNKIEFVPPISEMHRLFTTKINLCPRAKYGKISWCDYLRQTLVADSKPIL